MLDFSNAQEIAALVMIVAQSCNFQWPLWAAQFDFKWPLGLTWI